MASRRPVAPVTTAPPEWATFKKLPGLVLGFHGCDKLTASAIFAGTATHLHKSRNDYDWLGTGVYFWENDPWRALDFASSAMQQRHLTSGRVETPCVIGAVIDLGLCLNLLEIDSVREVSAAYEYLSAVEAVAPSFKLPVNTGQEMGARFLDKAVVETVHQLRDRRKLPGYDTVRSAFIEGDPIYPGAGFRRKNHIQIAVRDEGCIKGYFRLPGI